MGKLNVTERKELVRLAQARVVKAQEAVLTNLADSMKEGTELSTEGKRLLKRIGVLVERESKLSKEMRDKTAALGKRRNAVQKEMNEKWEEMRQLVSPGVLSSGEEPRVLNRNAERIISTIEYPPYRYSGRKRDTSPPAIAEALKDYGGAKQAVETIAKLQEIIDDEIPFGVWLGDSESATEYLNGLKGRIDEMT